MSDVLLTRSQIEGWEARKREIPDVIASLESEYRDIETKLAAVRTILGGAEIASESPKVRMRRRASPVQQAKPTWAFEIIRVLKEASRPMSYEELRTEIDKGPLEGDFERSTKGFYNAVSRLQKKSEIAKHSDRLFLYSDLQSYLRGVEDGSVHPLKPLKTHIERSPMGAEILAYVNANPSGVQGKDVIDYLRKDSRFSEQLTKNTSGGYNVIARLVDRREIRREDSVLYPSNENGEPAGSPDAEGNQVHSLFDPQMSTQGLRSQ